MSPVPSTNRDLEIRLLDEDLEQEFGTFLERLADDAGNTFHPHPLTRDAAREACRSKGADVRYVATISGQVVAYGLLRGWDEGYDVPSLGIAVDPSFRSRGIGHVLMELLHAVARLRGAKRVRLRVAPENGEARHLYEGMGYRFAGEERGQLVGTLDLRRHLVDSSSRTPGSLTARASDVGDVRGRRDASNMGQS